MHWAGATKRLQEISVLLQARLIKIVQRASEGAPQECQRGRPKVMLDEDREFMLDLIREEPTTTLATLQNTCHNVNGRWYSLSQPSVGAWMSLNIHSNKSHWLMSMQKHQKTLQGERVMQGTLQRGSVSTSKLCLTWTRLVSTSPCATCMDAHLNTTTAQFEQQKQHPLTLHALHCSFLTALQPFCITFHQSQASTSPAAIRDYRKEIRGFRKKTPTTQPQNPTFVRPIRDFRKKTPTSQDLVCPLFTAFAIYEKSSQSF